MLPSTPSFDRFVRNLHRRYFLLRGLERIGLALLFGCGGAVILMPILWWRGGSVFPAAVLSFTISVVIGLVMAILGRPTPLDAIMEADRQLKLADLLGTAWAIRRSSLSKSTSPDPWKATLLTLAEMRCRQLSPSTVLLHRWTSRRWGGVGLAMILILTLGLLSSQSARTQAGTESDALFAHPDSLGGPPLIARSVPDTSASHSPTRPRSTDPDDSANESQPSQPGARTDSDKTDPFSPNSADAHPPSAGDPNGSGAGATATSAAKSALPTLDLANDHASRPGQGPTASGGQSANLSDNHASDSPPFAGLTGSPNASTNPPPWQNPGWSEAQQKSRDTVQSRPTYEPYRDLIRDYFERR